MRRIALSVTMVLSITACATPELAGFVRDPSPVVANVDLPDWSMEGEPFAMTAGEGKILLVFFGYTSCPDVCPTTLADTRSALGQLGDDADKIEVAMATVDPERDTPEVITGYVQSFIPGAHALQTLDIGLLEEAAEPFGASFSVTSGSDGEVEVVHTGSLYAVDDEGRLLVSWPFGTAFEDIASDLRILLRSR